MDKTYKNGKVWRDCFGVFVEKSCPTRFIARCVIDGCNWRIHASSMTDKVSWAIKTLTGEHATCGRLEINPIVHNSSEEKVVIQGESNCRGAHSWYKACFFSFAAQLRGFLRGCRPIIGIDGARLSGYYKGILLRPVGIDGNNEIFMFVYGIVSTESETWGYFMRNLKCLFEKKGCNRDDWTFLSDRMKVNQELMQQLWRHFPELVEEYAVNTCTSTAKIKGFSGTTFHKLFWVAADGYNPYVFNKAMEKIHAYNLDVVLYLENTTEVWSRHKFDPVVCCDHNTTNFFESFNSCTKPYRDLPVLKLLEAIRQWCMKRMAPRFDKATSMGDVELTKYTTKILQIRSDEPRFCYATPCGGDEFEVRDAHVYYPIKLVAGTCGCGKWQHSGIPSKHVLKVIYHQRLQATHFVSPYFKGKAYKNTYGEHMHPMPDQTQWPSFNLPDILPPLVKRSAANPRNKEEEGQMKQERERNIVQSSAAYAKNWATT
ncbi:uncharacterized protein LOC110707582 [Chenopodium quinoa]|uniref:uncharacterized protein LOC110707582 n=1 Tax=Chenopodium quinoa TaxID=63459 RepID=UPI000B7904C2|nr:uncharacterized protein LOC110707582 [Chenopodium quinoa]